jgi:hypothetical protein
MDSGLFQGGDRDHDVFVADDDFRFSMIAVVNKQGKKRTLIMSGWRGGCSYSRGS